MFANVGHPACCRKDIADKNGKFRYTMIRSYGSEARRTLSAKTSGELLVIVKDGAGIGRMSFFLKC